jgi:hypothetical protein
MTLLSALSCVIRECLRISYRFFLFSQRCVFNLIPNIFAVGLAIGVPQATFGLDIQVQFNSAESNANDYPIFDPDASLLGGIVQYVASVYEDIIEDNHVLQLTYRWDRDLAEMNPPITTGLHTFGSESGGRETSGQIRFDPDPAWFIDPTPADDSEFNMVPVLYSGLTSTQQLNRYNGNVPAKFEAGYQGFASSTAPVAAQNNFDLVTLVFHEMGHALGMSGNLSTTLSETLDGDYEVRPSFVGGNVMAERVRNTNTPNNRAHLFGGNSGALVGPALMSSLGNGERRRPSAADIFAMSRPSNWFDIDLRRVQLLDGSALWHDGLSWLGGRTPNGDDNVSVLTGDAVLLSNDAFAGQLQVDDGSSLFTGGNLLFVVDQATIGGIGTGEVVIGGLFGPVASGNLQGNQLTINPGGTVRLNGGNTPVDAATVNMLAVELAGTIATNVGTQGVWNSATEVVGDSEIAVGDGGQLALNGNLSGTADIIKTGTGILALDGGNGNWTGDLLLQEGRVNFDSANALSGSTTLVLSDDTVADFSSDSETFGALEGSGRVLIGESNLFFDREVVVGVNDSNTVFTGTIPSRVGNLTQGGIGSMTLGPNSLVTVSEFLTRDGGSLVVNGGSIKVVLLDT